MIEFALLIWWNSGSSGFPVWLNIQKPGVQLKKISFKNVFSENQYGFVIFRSNPEVKIRCSEKRMTGILSVFNKTNPAVNNYGKQLPPEGSGFDSFEFWCPERRPKGQNIAMNISPALTCFSKDQLVNGYTRPYLKTNAWAADWNDKNATITLKWEETQTIQCVSLFFDTDYDHPMESSQMGHPEDVIPFCVRNFTIKDENGNLFFEQKDNYQTINKWKPESGFSTKSLCFQFEQSFANVPTSIFEILID